MQPAPKGLAHGHPSEDIIRPLDKNIEKVRASGGLSPSLKKGQVVDERHGALPHPPLKVLFQKSTLRILKKLFKKSFLWVPRQPDTALFCLQSDPSWEKGLRIPRTPKKNYRGRRRNTGATEGITMLPTPLISKSNLYSRFWPRNSTKR